jgi:hypothetical protein
MTCCYFKSNKRAKKNIKKYKRRNAIYPTSTDIPISEYVEKINRECIVCYHCKKMCRLCDNEIKIMCSNCDKFFHCHIAGKCRGKDCTHVTSNGSHALSYCLNCINPMTIREDTCLCNSCVLNESSKL